jgi:DNA-binding response OmpR family regulator
LSDIILPQGISGTTVAQEVKMPRPALKVLLGSGCAPDSIPNIGPNIGLMDTGANLLTKPFRRAELATKIREILDGDGKL